VSGPDTATPVGEDSFAKLLSSALGRSQPSTKRGPVRRLLIIEGVADGLAGATGVAGRALADDPHRRRDTAAAG